MNKKSGCWFNIVANIKQCCSLCFLIPHIEKGEIWMILWIVSSESDQVCSPSITPQFPNVFYKCWWRTNFRRVSRGHDRGVNRKHIIFLITVSLCPTFHPIAELPPPSPTLASSCLSKDLLVSFLVHTVCSSQAQALSVCFHTVFISKLCLS